MNEKRRRTGEEGVALIVVLGFLSLMLVMAVAFLRTAVTEEMVSDYSQEAIRSRQVLKSGIYAAMNDYSKALWKEAKTKDGPLLPVDDEFLTFTSEANGLDAISGKEGTLKGSRVDLMRGELLDWIPARYRTEDVTNALADAEWVLVREDPGKKSRILGRYAYACFDCSGALDANYVALTEDIAGHDSRILTNRVRRSVRDIPLALLPEVADGSQFKSYRRGWKGFDSPQMLVKLTDGIPEDGNGSSARWQTDRKETHGLALTSNLVSELTSYSLTAYRGGRYSRSKAEWTPPMRLETPDDWVVAIEKYFHEQFKGSPTFMGVQESELRKMVADFTSSQSTRPEGINYPSVKDAPMFNEISIGELTLLEPKFIEGIYTNSAGEKKDGYQYQGRISCQFELWYPFPSKDNDRGNSTFIVPCPPIIMQSYPEKHSWAATHLGFGLAVALRTPTGKMITVEMEGEPTIKLDNSEEQDKLVNCGELNPYSNQANWQGYPVKARFNTGKPYSVPKFTYTFKLKPVSEPYVSDGNCSLLWRNGWHTIGPKGAHVNGMWYYLKKSAAQYDYWDAIPTGISSRRDLSVSVQPGLDNASDKKLAMEAIDPRLNHDPDDWQMPETDAGTMGTTNSTIAYLGSMYKSAFDEEGRYMYCRNGAFETPADVGFLSTGKPWQTVDLLCSDAAEFFALTSMDTNMLEALDKNGVFYTNAQLNINSRCSNALASAFFELPTLEVPNWLDTTNYPKGTTNSLGEDVARKLAEDIMAVSKEKPFESGMDWVRIPQMQTGIWAVTEDGESKKLNHNQMEALIRNSYGTFNVADSLFLVVVVAQSVKEGPQVSKVGTWDDEDQVTGERRAVALVWRDPFKTGNNQHHEMLVRMFRYLND